MFCKMSKLSDKLAEASENQIKPSAEVSVDTVITEQNPVVAWAQDYATQTTRIDTTTATYDEYSYESVDTQISAVYGGGGGGEIHSENDGFSILGLSDVESWGIVAVSGAVVILILICLIVVIWKRRPCFFKFKIPKLNVDGEIGVNTGAMDTSASSQMPMVQVQNDESTM